MEIALVVFAVFVVWLWLRSRRAAEERRIQLATWDWDASFDLGRGDVMSDHWTFDFTTMKAKNDSGSDYVRTEHYDFRQRKGVWQMRQTEETFRARVDEARQVTRGIALDDAAALLAREHKGPQWQNVPEAAQGGLETAYQRYTRQG